MPRLFFSRVLGDYVVDEMCECGHLKSEHGSRTTRIGGSRMLRQANDGSCCKGRCECKQFTFARFVGLEEKAEMVGKRTPCLN